LVRWLRLPAWRKTGYDFQNVLGKFFLEAGLLTLVDNHVLDSLLFAQREHQFSAEPQQAILVGDHQSLGSSVQDQLKQLLKSLLAVAHGAAEIPDNLGAPSLYGAAGFKGYVLAVKTLLLVVAGHSGVAGSERFR